MCVSRNTLCHLFLYIILTDNMSLDLAGPNNTLLRCTVNVTSNPGFVLSILCDGQKTQSIGPDLGSHGMNLSYVSLSETVRVVGNDGKYECQLHLNKHLITSRSFEILVGNDLAPLIGKDFIQCNVIVLAKCETKQSYIDIIMINA